MSPTLPSGGRPLGLLVKMFPKLSETFILEEVLGLERLGVPLRLYALRAPTDAITHPAVARVNAPLTQVPELLCGRRREFAARHLRLFATRPLRYAWTLVVAIVRGRRGRDALQRHNDRSCRFGQRNAVGMDRRPRRGSGHY